MTFQKNLLNKLPQFTLIGFFLSLPIPASLASSNVATPTMDATVFDTSIFASKQFPEQAISQTLEIRDSGVPAKTVDDSGAKVDNDPLGQPTTQQQQMLTGVLTKTELKGKATVNDDGKSLTLYLVNQGKRALIFAGDNAIVSTGQVEQEKAKTQYEVIPPPKKVDVPMDIVNVAISIVTDGAVPALRDIITEYQPDGTAYYGKDQDRRKLAERRFGQRTLFPGESTMGRVYLPDNFAMPAQLSIPVVVHPTGESIGNLVLPISQPSPN